MQSIWTLPGTILEKKLSLHYLSMLQHKFKICCAESVIEKELFKRFFFYFLCKTSPSLLLPPIVDHKTLKTVVWTNLILYYTLTPTWAFMDFRVMFLKQTKTFSIILNCRPFNKDMALHLKQLESPLPRDAFAKFVLNCQVVLTTKPTTTPTTRDNESILMSKANLIDSNETKINIKWVLSLTNCNFGILHGGLDFEGSVSFHQTQLRVLCSCPLFLKIFCQYPSASTS